MRALRLLAVLAVLGFPLAASPAATADEAVAALIASLKDAGRTAAQQPDPRAVASLLERLLPHLAGPSQRMAEALVRASRLAHEHDQLARKAFGPALDKEDGYMPAEGSVAQFAAFVTPLASLRQGASAEIVERSATGEAAAYRVRWLSTAGAERERIEEAFIAVNEGGRWKLLVPGFGEVRFGYHTSGGQTENYVERPKKAWTGDAMRAENAATERRVEGLARLIESMSAEVKAGRFPNPRAYVEEIAARAQKM